MQILIETIESLSILLRFITSYVSEESLDEVKDHHLIFMNYFNGDLIWDII